MRLFNNMEGLWIKTCGRPGDSLTMLKASRYRWKDFRQFHNIKGLQTQAEDCRCRQKACRYKQEAYRQLNDVEGL